MSTRLTAFEQFIVLFKDMKRAAKDSPQRLKNFYRESDTVRQTTENLLSWLCRTDFERRVFHGPRKHFAQVPVDFEKEWSEYKEFWANPVVTAWAKNLSLEELKELAGDEAEDYFHSFQSNDDEDNGNEDLSLEDDFPKLSSIKPVDHPRGGAPPNADYESEFDPLKHDGGAALELGISVLNVQADFEDGEVNTNIASFSVEAYDYLTQTIGIDVPAIFRRWRNVPVIFMPAYVSNKHGLTEKGSLTALLDDAMRAYVCGAPAAAIAMCRAALEMVLKRHYGRGQWDDLTLGKMIVLADQKYDFVQEGRIRPLVDRTNAVLHEYSTIERMSADDDRSILNFLKTVKFLIQRAPKGHATR